MTRIIVLPHAELCKDGAVIEAAAGEVLLRVLLKNGIDLPHACEMSCACSTCHVVIREGFEALAPAGEIEDDQLDRAWGVERESRLSCQVIINQTPLVVELPRYSVHMAR